MVFYPLCFVHFCSQSVSCCLNNFPLTIHGGEGRVWIFSGTTCTHCDLPLTVRNENCWVLKFRVCVAIERYNNPLLPKLSLVKKIDDHFPYPFYLNC